MGSQAGRLAPARDDEHGMTLLELVVAISIFAIIMLGLAATLGAGLQLTRTNRHRTVAANLAAQEMDRIRSAEFASLATGQTTITVDGIDYEVRRETSWVSTAATTGPCDASGGSPQVLRVRVSVVWPNMGGVPPVVSDTTLTPPVGAYDDQTGHVGVKVLDRDAEPVWSVPVQLAGPQPRAGTTNSDGCAFFAFLPPGSYTATLSKPGYVSGDLVAQPSLTFSVGAGTAQSKQLDYDRGASLSITPATDPGYVVPNDVTMTVANEHLAIKTRTFAGSGNPRAIDELFPFADGYHVWAGGCADADPEGRLLNPQGLPSEPYWPGASRELPVEVTPGTTTATSVAVRSVDVAVVDGTGAPHAGVAVVARHAADNACADGEEYVIGVTDASGRVAAALPFGEWTIAVPGFVPPGAWPDIAADPRDSGPVAVQVTAT